MCDPRSWEPVKRLVLPGRGKQRGQAFERAVDQSAASEHAETSHEVSPGNISAADGRWPPNQMGDGERNRRNGCTDVDLHHGEAADFSDAPERLSTACGETHDNQQAQGER